jgi:predicted transposase YbfD/YdcC
VQQAARLTRFVDRKQAEPELETEWLITSRPGSTMSVQDMAKADRHYWGIENGLHLRLDVSAGEDRSRVSTPRSVLNLAMIRRATLSIAIDWIRHCPSPRQATLPGFYDAMSRKGRRKALSAAIASKPSSWAK